MDGVRARCGCRIDLGGGTFDIWPLGLQVERAVTVNVAIDLPVTVSITAARDAGYSIRGSDPRGGLFATTREMIADSSTALFGHLAEALELPPCELEAESASPRGGGLGASSAIGVAMIRAADRWLGRGERPVEETVRLARDVEARLMGWPTGIQDHYPSLFGGALAIEYRPGGERVRSLDVDLDGLGRHLLLVYSGQSHLSGETNWGVVRGFLDRDPGVRALFDEIARAAGELPEALESGDWPRVGELVAREWSHRRRLAEGVSVPRVERLLDTSRSLGGWGGKAGGAGGGGTVALLVPEERREEIAAALEREGGTVLDASPTERGVEVESLEAAAFEDRPG